jgi:hypothetical protein
MGAQLRGVEVYFSYHDERFHIHLPATLSPIIGKQGVLQCRLDSVRRLGAVAVSRTDTFEASFGADRRLVIPSSLANHCGISGGSALDLTILARMNLKRGWIRRRLVPAPIYPNDTVAFDRGDAASSRYAAPSYARGVYGQAYAGEQTAPPPFGDGVRPHLSPWQLARSIEQELAKPMASAAPPPSPVVPPAPAPAVAKVPADDEAANRRRWLEILDLYHAAKEGRIVVDNTRGIGIVPPEQPFRRARSG